MSWGNISQQLPQLSFRKITQHTCKLFFQHICNQQRMTSHKYLCTDGILKYLRSVGQASIVRFLKRALIQIPQVQEDLSEHPANHPSLRHEFLTQQGMLQSFVKTTQKNAGASLPTFHLNSSQILPDPFSSLAQVSACKKSFVLLTECFCFCFKPFWKPGMFFFPVQTF